MNENEELCGKVKAAQSLSRKDSMKSRHFETEIAHVKDEFDRLKLEYENTRQHVAVIDVRKGEYCLDLAATTTIFLSLVFSVH